MPRSVECSMRKRGQIWVETVIYTLIGMALIGIVLAVVSPRISDAKERIIIEQSINSLIKFDEKIIEALDWGPGNVRKIDFTMKEGELFIDPVSDEIIFTLSDLRKPYSEPGELIEEHGRVGIITREGQKTSSTDLILSYENVFDLTYNGGDSAKKFNAVATSYSFFVENLGAGDATKTVIDIRVASLT
jgi:type II secretory pathway pseudopilin PulG